MHKNLIEALRQYNSSFTDEEIQSGIDLFQLKEYKANDLITEMGKVCDVLFFASQSVTRCYYLDSEGKEQTLWMKPEGMFITEYKSFVHQEKSQFSLQFYEDTAVYAITRDDLMSLYKSSNNWALFGIALTEKVHISLIDVFVNLLANDATRNYQYIQYMFPRFLQVAPLKDIASMLNISQVSLSRIRAGNQLKG